MMAPRAAQLLVAALGCAACGRDAVPAPTANQPPARLLPLPRPDDTFTIERIATVDGRSESSAASATVRWRWSADAPDGIEVLRVEGLHTELWWRSDSGLALWDGDRWQTIEGAAPTSEPVSRERGDLRATVTTEQATGSGDRTDGCLRLRIAGRKEGDGATAWMGRVEERQLCPERGETSIDRTARGPLGELQERWVRR
jgi:hypothetical protein